MINREGMKEKYRTAKYKCCPSGSITCKFSSKILYTANNRCVMSPLFSKYCFISECTTNVDAQLHS